MADATGSPPPSGETALPDPDARPLPVTAASAVLLLIGVFTGLVGLVLLILVAVSANPAALPTYVAPPPAGFAAAAGPIGLVLLAYGAGAVLAGVQLLRRRRWARALGIALGGVGVAGLVIATIQASGALPAIFLPVIAALAYAAVALATEGAWFEGSRTG